jgi:hypothetical protein
VDTFTAERYSPHQIKRHNSKVQAPAPKGISRLVKGLSHTAQKRFFLKAHTHVHGNYALCWFGTAKRRCLLQSCYAAKVWLHLQDSLTPAELRFVASVFFKLDFSWTPFLLVVPYWAWMCVAYAMAAAMLQHTGLHEMHSLLAWFHTNIRDI